MNTRLSSWSTEILAVEVYRVRSYAVHSVLALPDDFLETTSHEKTLWGTVTALGLLRLHV